VQQTARQSRLTDKSYLKFLAVEEVSGGVHNVGGVSGVVVGIVGMIVGLDKLQPVPQNLLVARQKRRSVEPFQRLHGKMNQRTTTNPHITPLT